MKKKKKKNKEISCTEMAATKFDGQHQEIARLHVKGNENLLQLCLVVNVLQLYLAVNVPHDDDGDRPSHFMFSYGYHQISPFISLTQK